MYTWVIVLESRKWKKRGQGSTQKRWTSSEKYFNGEARCEHLTQSSGYGEFFFDTNSESFFFKERLSRRGKTYCHIMVNYFKNKAGGHDTPLLIWATYFADLARDKTTANKRVFAVQSPLKDGLLLHQAVPFNRNRSPRLKASGRQNNVL